MAQLALLSACILSMKITSIWLKHFEGNTSTNWHLTLGDSVPRKEILMLVFLVTLL